MGTDIHGVFQRRSGNKWEDIPSKYEQDRHYLLFAWLGNVRNGYGFAGVPTHTSIVPLSDCRGFPEDFEVSDESHPIQSLDILDPSRRKWHEENDPMEIWMGDHSHSWVSADEVISTPLPKILRTGIVSKKTYDSWDGKSSPKTWSGGVSGPGVVIGDPSSITPETSHVQIEWFEDTKDTLGYFVDEMKRLKDEYGEVRFVFGFDS